MICTQEKLYTTQLGVFVFNIYKSEYRTGWIWQVISRIWVYIRDFISITWLSIFHYQYSLFLINIPIRNIPWFNPSSCRWCFTRFYMLCELSTTPIWHTHSKYKYIHIYIWSQLRLHLYGIQLYIYIYFHVYSCSDPSQLLPIIWVLGFTPNWKHDIFSSWLRLPLSIIPLQFTNHH